MQQGSVEATTANPRFSNKSTRYLRSLDFSFIRTRFSSMKGSSSVQRKATILLYGIPILASIGVGGMHFVSQSFLIYLKYQAMVDSYYYQVVSKEN